ncbi:MAG: hypothetical protein ACC653_05570 [Gammaproteobacteria bacterium]
MSKFGKLLMNRFSLLIIVYSATVMVLFCNLQEAQAEQKLITAYVGVDAVENSAYAYDENFVRMPDNPVIPKTSYIPLPENQALWYVASNIDIVRRNDDGSIDIVSDNPAYSEMIHHLVWGYTAPNRQREFECGYPWLIPVGSELTNFHFPKGYAYKLDGGALFPIWHWENPANVAAAEKIYLRFQILVDDKDAGYKDTNIDWVDTVPCVSGFSVPPGKSKKVSPKWPVNSDRRIIAVLPHIHDHGDEIKFKSTQGTIREFKPEYQNIPVAHDDVGQGPTLLHSHKDHLPVDSLYAWTPGQYGPVIKAGDSLWLETEYDNPHDIDIDNMLIVFIFWEKL